MTSEVTTAELHRDRSMSTATSGAVRSIVIRWIILVTLIAFAFWRTIRAVAEEMMARTLISYLPVLILLTIIAAVGVSRREHKEPPIHDRQTDVIVAVVILVPALALQVMVNPRYGQVYLTTHIDLLAMWLFTLGGAVVLFGLRPVFRYRWVWLIFLAIFPVPARVMILWLGGGPVVAGAVVVAVATAATAVAAGRTARRALLGAILSAAVGIPALFAVYHGWIRFGDSPPPLAAMVSIPPLGCAMVATSVTYIDRRRRIDSRPLLGGPTRPPALSRVGRPIVLVATCAVLLACIPVPPVGTWPSTRITALQTGQPLPVPPGWSQESVERYDWVTRLVGAGSVLIRQTLVQTEGSTEFDELSRPRRVVVDTVDSARPLALEVYPNIFRYNLVGNRFGPAVEVPMTHGVRAWMWDVVDDSRYLTYDVVSWWWNNGYRTQQVMIWAVDNHEPDAYFPEPRITIAENLNSLFTVLFRGNTVIQDGDPQYKDRDLVVPLARDLVEATVARGASG